MSRNHRKSLLALSFNLLFGMTGLLSFGQGAFYAGGAYSAALLLRAGVPLLWSILLGALAAAALAAVLGAFCVRHTRIYFSMLTLAFGMLVYAVVWKWTDVTGGDDGLIGIPRGRIGLPGPLDFSLDSPARYYLFAAVLVLLSMAVLHRLSASPLGLALRATPCALSLRSSHPRLCDEGNRSFKLHSAHAPSSRRNRTSWPKWYALWSATSSASRKMFCPVPWGIFL